jgi:hypothetical protein
MGGWLWNLVNVGCSLAGYYMAALLIDHKFYGRRRMQSIGFLADFILFIISAALFNTLQQPGRPVKIFQFMYFFSSFWNQFGPNSTTFLLAAEVYPAPIRSTAHGISAACGKLGALVPAVLYNYISNNTKFWVVSWFGLVGFVLTVLFVPDTTGLDLREQERYWMFVRNGRADEYHGIAINPRHLSLFERLVLRRQRHYNPELDRLVKIDELRARFEEWLESEKTGKEMEMEDIHSFESLSDNASRYFQLERQRSMRNLSEKQRETKPDFSGSDDQAGPGSSTAASEA